MSCPQLVAYIFLRSTSQTHQTIISQQSVGIKPSANVSKSVKVDRRGFLLRFQSVRVGLSHNLPPPLQDNSDTVYRFVQPRQFSLINSWTAPNDTPFAIRCVCPIHHFINTYKTNYIRFPVICSVLCCQYDRIIHFPLILPSYTRITIGIPLL